MRRFALVDDQLVEDTLFLKRELGSVVLRHPEPVLDHCQISGSVLRDTAGQWRAWYEQFVSRDASYGPVGSEVLGGYATSRDGIYWERPKLGIVDEGGSKDNHFVMGSRMRDANGRYLTGWGGPAGMAVVDAQADPHPAARGRFTAMYLASPVDVYGGICLAWSDDGLHWTAYPENPVIPGSPDSQNIFLFDRRLGKYVCYQRPTVYAGMDKHANRKFARCESDDLVHWTVSRVCLDTDERDAPGLEVHVEPGMNGVARGRTKQYQGMTPFLINGGTCYLGIAEYYCVKTGTFGLELVHSDDGKTWKREALREPLIAKDRPLGFPGMLPVPAGSPPILVGDEHWIYLSDTRFDHFTLATAEDTKTKEDVAASWFMYVMSIKRDRWVGYRAGEHEGELVTTPFDWEGGSPLHLNAQIEEGGHVEVTFEDAWARPVREYHLDEIPRIVGPVDAVDHLLTFGPGPKTVVKLPAAINQVRLRFKLRRATLYGWRIG